MDLNLLKEVAGFKKRFFDNVTEKTLKNVKTKYEEADSNALPTISLPPIFRVNLSEPHATRDVSKKQFAVLARIVLHMRTRHLRGDSFPLTLNEILEETKLQVAGNITKWLKNDALPNNPKIKVCENDEKFKFRPPYKMRDGRCLLRQLKRHDLKSLGGILLQDVEESLPNASKVLKRYKDDILIIDRPRDKKKVLFYNDTSLNMEVSDGIKKLWRSIGVSDDNHVQQHLEKEGINSMKSDRKLPQKRVKHQHPKRAQRNFKKPRDNEHCADVLKHYMNFDQN